MSVGVQARCIPRAGEVHGPMGLGGWPEGKLELCTPWMWKKNRWESTSGKYWVNCSPGGPDYTQLMMPHYMSLQYLAVSCMYMFPWHVGIEPSD